MGFRAFSSDNFRSASVLTLVTSLVVLQACGPHDSGGSSAMEKAQNLAHDERISAETSCEASLRNKIKTFDLVFEKSDRSALTAKAESLNSRIKQLKFDEKKYSASQLKQKFTSIKTSGSGKIGASRGILSGELSRVNDDTTFVYALGVSYEETSYQPYKKNEFQETWKAGADCKLVLDSVSENESGMSGRTVTYRKSSSNLDGRAGSERSETKSGELPQGGILIDSVDLNPSEVLPYMRKHLGQTFYSAGTDGSGVTGVTFEAFDKKVTISDPITSASESAESLRALLKVGGSDVELIYTFARNNPDLWEVTFAAAGSATWNLPESSWDRVQIKDGSFKTQRTFETYPATTPGQSSITAYTLEPLNYDHLESYWKKVSVTPLKADSEGWKYKYKFIPVDFNSEKKASAPVDLKKLKSLPSSLKESEFVQISLPAIQAIIKDLKPKVAKMNRLEIAEVILPVIQSKITYDYESLNDGKITPLKTEEILARGKGVCQHYANLFAAVARGLGVPTRMVSGYHAGESGKPAGGHAWNEIEVEPGVWRPIEPQTTLRFDSYSYLPMTDARMLETNKASPDDLKVAIAWLNQQFKIQVYRN